MCDSTFVLTSVMPSGVKLDKCPAPKSGNKCCYDSTSSTCDCDHTSCMAMATEVPECTLAMLTACLDEGQDCTDVTAACCAGTECVSTDGSDVISPGSGKLACKALPACVGPGLACTSNTDCCASMDCTGGRCMPKQAACLDSPTDGVCGGSSGATCCPGTECKSRYSFEPPGCMIPSTTWPQETGCPREQPAFHEACRASKLGLQCTYQDWMK